MYTSLRGSKRDATRALRDGNRHIGQEAKWQRDSQLQVPSTPTTPGDDDGGGGGANRWRKAVLAMTAIGGNSADSIVASTVSTARNHWGKDLGHFLFKRRLFAAACSSSSGRRHVSIEDVCARLQKRPFDPGIVSRSTLPPDGAFADVFRPGRQPDCHAWDSSAGVIATIAVRGINRRSGRSTRSHVRFPETTVSESYVPTTGSQQWVRVRAAGRYRRRQS